MEVKRYHEWKAPALVILTAVFLLGACADNEEAPQQSSDLTAATQGTSQAETVEGTTGKAEAQELSPEEIAENPGLDGETAAQPDPAVENGPWKSITVCLQGSEIELFPYSADSPAALGIMHTLYEPSYLSLTYAYQAQGLEKIPSLRDGDARRASVMVGEGDHVVDASGSVVSLREGVSVRSSSGEIVEYAGEPLELEQLIVDFTFKPQVWSDGTPVTAADSVFSYNIAADPARSFGKTKTGYTQSYEALDEMSVRWTGLPGFLDDTYFTNIWTPLPAHTLGRFTAAELGQAEEVTRQPLSSGPFVVESWDGDQVVNLGANENYYRSSDGLPRVRHLTVRYGDVEDFLSGDGVCDVIAGGALGSHNLGDLEAAGSLAGWELIYTPGNVYEQIAFGVTPVSEYRDGRPDWFGSAGVRSAITMCTDREAMRDALMNGEGAVMQTLAPPDHPLVPEDLTEWSYDPEEANRLLDELGYRDYAEDGRRQDVASGQTMTITLGTNSESDLRLQIGEMFKANMAECGIPVILYDRPAGTWFGSGPEGPVFGRQFDLASLAWLGKVNPDCGLFTSENISGPEEFGFGGWSASNVSGWSDEAYDAACRMAQSALPGGDGYEANMKEAMRLYNQLLPTIPLFTNYKVVAVRPGILNVQPDPTQPSELWNIAEWDVAE